MRLAVLDALHERVVPVVVVSLGFLLVGVPVARATGMGAPTRVVLDFALWWAWLSGCALAMWLGSRCIAGPLDDRTAMWELTGPVSPGLWGLRRLGGSAAVAVAAHGVVLCAALALGGLPAGSAAVAVLTTLEILLLVALAGGLGAVFRPLPALVATATLWLVGHVGGLFRDLLAEDGLGPLASAVLAAIPDLDLLDVHGAVVRGEVPPAGQVLLAAAWSLAWTCAAAAATVSVLNRRDLA
ncbi:MAG: hypothetical protein H6737_01255 [Alphaproteobacteria bacterium]|nr:hypothetical protein [Alphaproteobacteria bacterium]